MKGDIVFTTSPKLLETFQKHVGINQQENYEDEPLNPLLAGIFLFFWMLFFLLWIYAIWIVIAMVQRLRKQDKGINALFIIFLLFILFYMPMFGTLVVFVVVYPEARKVLRNS
jgi:hypothetical protein